MKTSFKTVILWTASIILLVSECESSSIRKDYKEEADETFTSTVAAQPDAEANDGKVTSSEKQTTAKISNEVDVTTTSSDSHLEFESSTVKGQSDDSSESAESDESVEDETGKPLSSTSAGPSEDEQTETTKAPLEEDSDSSSSSDSTSDESASSSSSESNENTDASSSSSSSSEEKSQDDTKLSNKQEASNDKRKPEKFVKNHSFGKTGMKLNKKDKARKIV